MSNTKLLSFVQQVIAVLKGDDAEVTAIKIQRQAKNALTPQIAVKISLTSDLEDQVEQRKEALKLYLINNGKLIENRDIYIKDLLTIKQNIVNAEEELSLHLQDIKFLEECLEDVTK